MDADSRGVISRAALWAVAGSIVGVVCWSLLGATVAPLLRGLPLYSLGDWLAAFLGTGVLASVAAAMAAPYYFAAFMVWQLIVRRYPGLVSSEPRRMLAALVLASPVAFLVAVDFATGDWPTIGVSFAWRAALETFPMALLSSWLAVWLPWRLIPGLRDGIPYAPRGG